jgi:hypothetical protein
MARRLIVKTPANPRLQRTRAARSPLSRQPLGAAIKPPAGVRQGPRFGFAGPLRVIGRNARTTTPARGQSSRLAFMPARPRSSTCQNCHIRLAAG